ncbi:MAG: hypothetical protein KY467_09740 [Gemmatimonadetes bacterium]|nr:hypothetical protein [Gemmatimonadota bacterium]
MAYCRFGRDSDVYVYAIEGGVECCRCRLLDGRWFKAPDAAQMMEHLLAHRAAGHRVPESALDELRQELAA